MASHCNNYRREIQLTVFMQLTEIWIIKVKVTKTDCYFLANYNQNLNVTSDEPICSLNYDVFKAVLRVVGAQGYIHTLGLGLQ